MIVLSSLKYTFLLLQNELLVHHVVYLFNYINIIILLQIKVSTELREKWKS